jgi:hypothetical protein
MLVSVLLLILVYGSSGFLKNLPDVLILLYLATYSIGVKYLWKGNLTLLLIFSVGVTATGPLIESLIALTSQFHYLSPDLWKVPIWLPLIYLNAVFIGANFDNYISGQLRNR